MGLEMARAISRSRKECSCRQQLAHRGGVDYPSATFGDRRRISIYIELQLFIAERELLNGRVVTARAAAERALSLLLTLRQPISYGLTMWLPRVYAVLRDTGDVIRSAKLTLESEPFIRRQAVVGGPAWVSYLEHTAWLSERIGDFPRAASNFRDTLELYRRLEMPQHHSERWPDYFLLEEAGACLFSGDLSCAEKALTAHSRRSWLDVAISPHPESMDDISYLGAVLLLKSLKGNPLPRNGCQFSNTIKTH